MVSFLLTPQERRRKIPATFSVRFQSAGPERFAENVCRERWAARDHRDPRMFSMCEESSASSTGGKACCICRDGQCNASIRSARLAVTGCAYPTPLENSAAIAALPSIMFRLRLAHACGCAPARSVVTVRRAVRQDDSDNRRGRTPGLLVRHGGRAVPANALLPKTITDSCRAFPAKPFGGIIRPPLPLVRIIGMDVETCVRGGRAFCSCRSRLQARGFSDMYRKPTFPWDRT